MVTILFPQPPNDDDRPRLVRIPVNRPPVAAVASTPDGGQSFTLTGLSRNEATWLAILIGEHPSLGYIGHDLGRLLFPDVETEVGS